MRAVSLLLALSLALLTACGTPDASVQREKLKSDPSWPIIRKAAQQAIITNEPSRSGWSRVLAEQDFGALYPTRKDGETWVVQGCGDYPDNTYGIIVEMVIRSDGKILRYSQLWKKNWEKSTSLWLGRTQKQHLSHRVKSPH